MTKNGHTNEWMDGWTVGTVQQHMYSVEIRELLHPNQTSNTIYVISQNMTSIPKPTDQPSVRPSNEITRRSAPDNFKFTADL